MCLMFVCARTNLCAPCSCQKNTGQRTLRFIDIKLETDKTCIIVSVAHDDLMDVKSKWKLIAKFTMWTVA